MQQTNEIKCPNCGQKIQVVDHPDKKDKVVAYCDCRPKLGVVAVWEADKNPPKAEVTK